MSEITTVGLDLAKNVSGARGRCRREATGCYSERRRVEIERITERRIGRVTRRDRAPLLSVLPSLNPAGWPLRGFPYLESPGK